MKTLLKRSLLVFVFFLLGCNKTPENAAVDKIPATSMAQNNSESINDATLIPTCFSLAETGKKIKEYNDLDRDEYDESKIDRLLGTSKDYRDALKEKNISKLQEILQNPQNTSSVREQFVIGMGYKVSRGIKPSDEDPSLGDLISGPDEFPTNNTKNKKRLEEAKKWLLMAANKCHIGAALAVADVLIGMGEYKQSIKWTTVLAEHDLKEAQHRLGLTYGAPPEPVKEFSSCEQAYLWLEISGKDYSQYEGPMSRLCTGEQKDRALLMIKGCVESNYKKCNVPPV